MGRCGCSIGAVARENYPGSLQKDLQIKPNRPALNILEVKANHLIEAGSASPGYLP